MLKLNMLVRVSKALCEKSKNFMKQHLLQYNANFVTAKLTLNGTNCVGLYTTNEEFDLVLVSNTIKLFSEDIVDVLADLVTAERDLKTVVRSSSFRNAVLRTRTHKQCKAHDSCCYCDIQHMNILRPDWSTFELRFQDSLVRSMLELGYCATDIINVNQTQRMFSTFDRIASNYIFLTAG